MIYMLKIELDNDAFGDDSTVEVARILRCLADRLDTIGVLTPLTLRDINGNRVGIVEIEDE